MSTMLRAVSYSPAWRAMSTPTTVTISISVRALSGARTM